MRTKWVAILFIPIFFLLIGVYLTRSFWPTEVVNTVIRKEIEQLPAEVIEKVLTDTVVSVRWRDRVVEKIKYREAIPETVIVYKEKVMPKRFGAYITYLKYRKPHLRYFLYSIEDSTVSLFTHKIKNDFEISIDQQYGIPRVRESKNFFDGPVVKIGWLNTEGAYIESDIRIWRMFPIGRANQDGVGFGMEVRYGF